MAIDKGSLNGELLVDTCEALARISKGTLARCNDLGEDDALSLVRIAANLQQIKGLVKNLEKGVNDLLKDTNDQAEADSLGVQTSMSTVGPVQKAA